MNQHTTPAFRQSLRSWWIRARFWLARKDALAIALAMTAIAAALAFRGWSQMRLGLAGIAPDPEAGDPARAGIFSAAMGALGVAATCVVAQCLLQSAQKRAKKTPEWAAMDRQDQMVLGLARARQEAEAIQQALRPTDAPSRGASPSEQKSEAADGRSDDGRFGDARAAQPKKTRRL